MRTHLLSARLLAVSLSLALLLCFGLSANAQQSPTAYKSTFSIAEQSVDAKGHTVIVMQGEGELPGVLTLVLSIGADGGVTGGEWALNVSYTAPEHPFKQIDPTLQDPDSAMGEILVHKGVLSGRISAGSTVFANGVVSTINSLQLVITHGSMQFAKVTQGTGTIVGTHIHQRANSSAASVLTF
jgi:hypothetical protein